MTGTLYEDRFMFLIISHSFLLRIRYALDKCGENQITHLCSKSFFPKIVPFMR
jgi:hypothetical protein